MGWSFCCLTSFPSRAVQILNPQDGRVLMVNDQRLKLVVTNEIAPGLIDSINLVNPITMISG